LHDFYRSLPESEKERVESLEVFDEFEEFALKCSHYTVLVAVPKQLLYKLDIMRKAFTPLEVHSPPEVKYSLKPFALSVDSAPISR
jgi:tRNA wybutosine-synthesizing protein 4